ncbi:MAG: hypothetical protein KatS3mg083_379 [Candidatus Dojkabacteria bacterium]|nr:MAG: hypothetical protein KatS3mg083_379 [Candidatus Dojkabacteria bacterium]
MVFLKEKIAVLLFFIILLIVLIAIASDFSFSTERRQPDKEKKIYWFVLHRKSNKENLFYGVPGQRDKSQLIKTFFVKTGIPGERPTPLPKILGREYWLITKKELSSNKETAPYFLTLNIPTADNAPYGPSPYLECNGQCNWMLPGPFGLHGVGGDLTRLSPDDPGSSGCIRHRDEDITYLYNLLQPQEQEIRYYIEDN